MRFAVPILLAATAAALAGYRAMQLRSVQALVPGWVWPTYWILVGSLFAMVPVLWWLDF